MQTVETILGNKPSLRKAILLECANNPTGTTVKDIEKKLGVSGIDKNHLKKIEEFGILEICHIEVCRPAGRFRTKTVCMDKGYRLKQDPAQDSDTFPVLLDVFLGTKYYETFLDSEYCKKMVRHWCDSDLFPSFSFEDQGQGVASAIAFPWDGLHYTINKLIMKYAWLLLSMMRTFYPSHSLNDALKKFIDDVDTQRTNYDDTPADVDKI